MNSILVRVVKSTFDAVGLEIRRKRVEDRAKPWDRAFADWIAQAEKTGRDPNDIGDVAWEGVPLLGAKAHLLPHVTEDSVVLEIGPGTGRMTRHVLPRCKRMILIDYSRLVCDWLGTYLKGKGAYEIHQIDRPSLGPVQDQCVDLAFAFGVFEHVDLDDFFCFLQEFHRVLRPGGIAWFNFDTMMSQGGLQWFLNERARLKPGVRTLFRFYHPDMIRNLAISIGFEISRAHADDERLAWFELRKALRSA